MNKEIIKIQNFGEDLYDIRKLTTDIQNNFQALVKDFTNKVVGRLTTNPLTEIRTDTLIRIESIVYFIELMKREETLFMSINENLHSSQRNSLRPPFELSHKQKSIFDAILYNLGSVFDYYARLLDFLYNGKLGWKWNNLVNSARDSKSTRIGENHRYSLIKFHRDFVDALFSHRYLLIHSKVSHPGYRFTKFTGEGRYEVDILTPQKFIKEFRGLKEIANGKSVSLDASCVWITSQGFKILNELLIELKDEIETLRRIDFKNHVILFNQKD